jgi:hypothetical protein
MRQYKLRVQMSKIIEQNGQKIWSPAVDVLDEKSMSVHRFDFMCSALDCDIQGANGSGSAALKAISKIESGESVQEELGGNAWSTYLTAEKVWFEGLYSQGEGGEVALEQYKLAVQTYVRFLSDSERKPFEVIFPDA